VHTVSAISERVIRLRQLSISSIGLAASVIGLVALFTVSSIDKLFHLSGFYLALRSYVLVPPETAPFLTLFVPLLELWVGIGLAVPMWRRYAAIAAATLLTVFAGALGANHLAGVGAPCGCMFSLTLSEATVPHIVFNCLAASLALTLCIEQGVKTDS
jgi:uncharacterized membrane protein YphA (DoxX/SURF4 family)